MEMLQHANSPHITCYPDQEINNLLHHQFQILIFSTNSTTAGTFTDWTVVTLGCGLSPPSPGQLE